MEQTGRHFSRQFAVRLRVAAVVVIVALVVIAEGCEPEITKEVLFINDSLTHQSILSIVEEMNQVLLHDASGRYAPNFGSSVPGVGLLQLFNKDENRVNPYWVAHLSSLVEHVDPEVIVVELGYNDCAYDLSTYGDSIDRFMDSLPAEIPVHWLTVADVSDLRTCDETINAALEDATTRWSNLSLFDFAAHMQGHPEWSDDGLHLNSEGQREYAAWLHHQLDAMYAGF